MPGFHAISAFKTSPNDAASRSTTVVAFSTLKRPANRLNLRDRILALEWAERVRGSFARVELHDGADEGQPELGDFILIYRPDSMWATWAVGCADGGYVVWQPGSRATEGRFASLHHALASIQGDADRPSATILPFR